MRILRGSADLNLVPGIIMANVLLNIWFHALSTKLGKLHFLGIRIDCLEDSHLIVKFGAGGLGSTGYDCELSQSSAKIHNLLLFVPFIPSYTEIPTRCKNDSFLRNKLDCGDSWVRAPRGSFFCFDCKIWAYSQKISDECKNAAAKQTLTATQVQTIGRGGVSCKYAYFVLAY